MSRIAFLARHPRRSLTALATLVAAGAVVGAKARIIIDFYAPRSTVNVNNNTLFHGGLAALVVNFNNAANFEWDSAVSALS